MEVVHLRPPSPAAFDFNYDSASTSPYATAPSSPQSTIPFVWEEKPGIPKQNDDHNSEQDFDTEFAFGHLERHSISAADELFDCGKIKPLKPPPRLHFSNDSPKSPKSPKSRFKDALSPRSSKKKDFDPFSEALKQTSGEQDQNQTQNQNQNQTHYELQQRGGRERTAERIIGRKGSRSLSPFRDSSDLVDGLKTETDRDQRSSSITWYSKWNLKNLLLFRSASEGNVTTRKDPLKKYSVLKKSDRNVKAFSFRSTESGGGGGAMADETNFTTVGEEMRKKTTTSSSHKSGLMGCLRFHQNGGSIHEISRGINSVIKHGN